MNKLPVLVLTPHSSGNVPADILAEMLGDNVFSQEARAKRLEWLFLEGDQYTDLIYHAPEAYNLHAQATRFVVDLNRKRDEDGENGVIKLTDFEKRPLYPAGFELTSQKREERLRRYFDTFHAEVEATLAANDIRLIIDGHSMQPHGPKISPTPGVPRPAITLMTSSDENGQPLSAGEHSSISPEQTSVVMTLLEKHFMPIITESKTVPHEIALNKPWSHDEISYHYSDPQRKTLKGKNAVPAFGIEFNHALYLIYQDGKELPNEPVIKQLNTAFQNFLREVVEMVKS
ncbi:MAG: N-formylglutamate amidohydrolase [Trueperaceae bacterium]